MEWVYDGVRNEGTVLGSQACSFLGVDDPSVPSGGPRQG